MRIEDIDGKRVLLSPHSITCVDECGKTCGVVRGVRRLDDLSGNDAVAVYRTLKRHGLWDADWFELSQFYCLGFRQFDMFYIMLDPTLYPLAEERERYGALLEQLNAQSDIKVILVNELRKGK